MDTTRSIMTSYFWHQLCQGFPPTAAMPITQAEEESAQQQHQSAQQQHHSRRLFIILHESNCCALFATAADGWTGLSALLMIC
jgi:hypothetical protein